jgi:hypothetical protein
MRDGFAPGAGSLRMRRLRIAQLEFRINTSGFRAPAAPATQFGTVQRGWRDFRIAQ